MGRQLIVFGVVIALAVFHAAADEVEPSETPNPVQEVSPGVADELESSEVQESIHETQPGEAANEGGMGLTATLAWASHCRAWGVLGGTSCPRIGESKQYYKRHPHGKSTEGDRP